MTRPDLQEVALSIDSVGSTDRQFHCQPSNCLFFFSLFLLYRYLSLLSLFLLLSLSFLSIFFLFPSTHIVLILQVKSDFLICKSEFEVLIFLRFSILCWLHLSFSLSSFCAYCFFLRRILFTRNNFILSLTARPAPWCNISSLFLSFLPPVFFILSLFIVQNKFLSQFAAFCNYFRNHCLWYFSAFLSLKP